MNNNGQMMNFYCFENTDKTNWFNSRIGRADYDVLDLATVLFLPCTPCIWPYIGINHGAIIKASKWVAYFGESPDDIYGLFTEKTTKF
jgi:hypothetical protein